MILKNKKALILSSVLILLPIPIGLLLRDRLAERMTMNGFVWGIPVAMLAVHWLCILFTAMDRGNKNRNQKPLSLVLWIIPVITNLSVCGSYALVLGVEFSPVAWTMVPMGLLFVFIGNYMPKTRMNSTMGIKVPWAYSSEENWNATHRFAGKVWVIGGLLMILAGLLPNVWAVTIMTVMIFVMCFLPIVYSWRFYKKELAEGKNVSAGYSKTDKKILKWSAVFLVLFTVFICFVLFFGDIHYVFNEDHLLVDTNMYTDYVLRYDTIENIEYRDGNVPGLRVGGYGSFRLLMGFFQNDEFGTYTRYTYYKPEACVVLTSKGKTIVLSGVTAEETRELYETLKERTEK